MVPRVTAVITRTAWTSRKDVGEEWPTVPVQARESSQMARENLGQMAQLNTPTATRKMDQPRDRITWPVSARILTPRLRRRCEGGDIERIGPAECSRAVDVNCRP